MPPEKPSIEHEILTLLSRIEIDDGVEAALRVMGDRAQTVLLRVARGEIAEADLYQRGNALYLIGRLGLTQASDDLIKVLERETVARLRLSALHSLGRIGDAASRKAIIRLLQSPKADRNEQISALRALADIGVAEDVDVLEKLQLDPSFPLLEAKRQDAIAAIRFRINKR